MLLTECNLITFVPSDLRRGRVIDGRRLASHYAIITLMALVANRLGLGNMGWG